MELTTHLNLQTGATPLPSYIHTCLVAWLSTRSTLHFSSYWFNHCTLNMLHNLKEMCTAFKQQWPCFWVFTLCCQHFTDAWRKGTRFLHNIGNNAHNMFDGVLELFRSTAGCLYQSMTMLQPGQVRNCSSIPTWGKIFFLVSKLSTPPLQPTQPLLFNGYQCFSPHA